MLRHVFLFIFAGLVAAAPARAQLDSPTPQYSGPSAGFDRGYSDYGAARRIQRLSGPAERRETMIRRDDRAVDIDNRARALSVQSEMALQRENARRAAGAIRTND